MSLADLTTELELNRVIALQITKHASSTLSHASSLLYRSISSNLLGRTIQFSPQKP
jgi:hypothetical protein